MTDTLIGALAAAKRSQRRLKVIMDGIPNNGGVFQTLRGKRLKWTLVIEAIFLPY